MMTGQTLCIWKKNLVPPPLPRGKNFGPPFGIEKKFWSPLWPTEKKTGSPFDHPKKFWSPLHKQTAPLLVKMIAPY